MRFSVLASGSSGNASLIEAGGFGVLLDAGLGPRLLAGRLADIGASWHQIHTVLLTHVHGDHWNERTFVHLERRRIPVYCHAEHRERLSAESTAFAALEAERLVHSYEPGQEVRLGPRLHGRPIPVRHDAGVTCGFRFETSPDIFGQNSVLGYATDLGSWEPELARALANVHVLALEFNHDVHMELNSGRSPELIARVLGDAGHLSNEQAARLVRTVLRHSQPGRLQHLVQLHLSRECNHPALARAVAQETLADHPHVRIHTARQHRTGPSLSLRIPPRQPGRKRSSHSSTADSQPLFPDWV
jgi:phosphoribosyl 1,2-cyclic phosphodiesterase